MIGIVGFLFTLLILIGVPIYVAILIPSIVGLLISFPQMDMVLIIQKMVNGVDVFSLLAIPFFMFAADIMSRGNIGGKLINFAKVLVGHLHGGLAITTILTCTIFGAISGAGPAAVVALGPLLYPALLKAGYGSNESLGCITASSTLAMLVPPGIAMILYGVSANVSIGKIFMSGLTIGVICALLFSIYAFVDAIRKNIPRDKRATAKEKFVATKKAFWALGLPVIILVGIYAGIMTPTEAAAIAVGYVFIVEFFIYKSMTLKEFAVTARQSGKMVAMIFILIASGSLLAYLFNAAQIPQSLVQLATGQSPILILLMINLMLFLAGMLIDPNSIVIVFTPLIYPLAMSIGVHPLHLGMMIVFSCAIGMITPPFGLNIFVAQGTFHQPYTKIVRSLYPYILLMVILLLFVIFVPELSLWIPNRMTI